MSRPALEVISGGKDDRRRRLEGLYARSGGAIYGRCRYLLKDATAAEDAMQDVFARALEHGASYRGEASELTWLLKIATHHCLNVLRAGRAAWRDQYTHLELARGEGHGGAAPLEARDVVRRALSWFDAETQAAAVHYWLDEMTLEEIAALLERSVPTIRKRLRDFEARTGQRLRDDEAAEGSPS
jgi:RNA polymerase sigma-70 factor (ECF subfamily)